MKNSDHRGYKDHGGGGAAATNTDTDGTVAVINAATGGTAAVERVEITEKIPINPFIFSLSTEALDKARTYTLSNWPSITPSAQDMCYAGWWYTNIADRVICIHCDAMFHSWNETDRPYEIHRLKSPQCFFIRATEQRGTNNATRQTNLPIPTANDTPNGPGMLQTIVGAVHADYAAIFRRSQTFHNWPEKQASSLPSIESFVDAGFFYTGSIYLNKSSLYMFLSFFFCICR